MEHNQIRRTVRTKQRRKVRCDEWVAYSTHSWRAPIVVEYKTNLGIEFGWVKPARAFDSRQGIIWLLSCGQLEVTIES